MTISSILMELPRNAAIGSLFVMALIILYYAIFTEKGREDLTNTIIIITGFSVITVVLGIIGMAIQYIIGILT